MKPVLLMIALFLQIWVAAEAAGKTVAVKSGEHDSFSRLVIDLGAKASWRFGRVEGGYELSVGQAGLVFDISQVFKLIPRRRLSAIWADPNTGNLHLGIACACHAIPIEFRPGILVIDIKEGTAPAGSDFELSLAGHPTAGLLTKQVMRPRSRPIPPEDAGFDWQAIEKSLRPDPMLPQGFPGVDLSPLRNTLLRQLSEGATRGTIEMTVPPHQMAAAAVPSSNELRIGEDIGFEATQTYTEISSITPQGVRCIDDQRLDIRTWGEEVSVATQMATLLTGLTGEFDQPDTSAVARAVRFYLYLGFGHEARQLMQSMGQQEVDGPIWETIAQMVDFEHVAQNPFSQMQGCNTAAAIWSVLAMPALLPSDHPNTQAILRSFSALPIHLRRHLGPKLAEKFLAIKDDSTVHAISDAITRAPGEAGPQVAVMQAKIMMAEDAPAEAEAVLAGLALKSGPAEAEALIAYVDAQLQQGKPIDHATVLSLAALIFERGSSKLAPKLQRAYGLALAASGDFASAFAESAAASGMRDEIWHLAAEQAPDSAFLEQAVLPSDAIPMGLDIVTRRKIAARLIGLGFSNEALFWLVDIVADQENALEDDRILVAKIALQQRNARGAMRLLAGLGSENASILRARALTQMGDSAAAFEIFAAPGEIQEEQRAARLAKAWPIISSKGDTFWSDAAALISAPIPMPDSDRPLAHGKSLVEESENARTKLKALLLQVSNSGENSKVP